MFVTPVDSDAALAFVAFRPMDSEPMLAAVDVDNALIVELRSVDGELTQDRERQRQASLLVSTRLADSAGREGAFGNTAHDPRPMNRTANSPSQGASSAFNTLFSC